MSDKRQQAAAAINANIEGAAAAADAILNQQPEPAQPQNRYRELFTAIQFQTVLSGKQYPNTDGSVSRKVAAGVCIVRGGFVGVNFNVYARKMGAGKGKVTVDVSFVGTRATQALSPLDERSKAEFSEYKGWLASQFADWRKKQGAAPVSTSRTAAELDDELAAGIFDE